jgi:hypothetical protein
MTSRRAGRRRRSGIRRARLRTHRLTAIKVLRETFFAAAARALRPGGRLALAALKADQARIWGSASWHEIAERQLFPVHDGLVARLEPTAG